MPEIAIAPAFRLREYRPQEDIPALVTIANQEYPDEPSTIEQEEHWERSYPAQNPRLRFAVESDDGQFVGIGDCLRPFWISAPGVFLAFVLVHPQWRRRGIGRAFLAEFEPYARGQGAEKLWTDCRESQEHSIRFLERMGFATYGIRFESALDLEHFDETPFAGVFDRVASGGYILTTLAEERRVRPDADRDLFELYRVAMADVPFPGGARLNPVYEQWRHNMLEGPATDPACIFLARHGDQLVGLTTLQLLQDGPVITGSTGVLAEHRGKGIAMALKLTSFRAAKTRGYKETRAHNDTANPPILALNEKLGYRRLPGWLQWEKRL